MLLFWKYFFQGFGYYFKPNITDSSNRTSLYNDFSKVVHDFNNVYNKISGIK